MTNFYYVVIDFVVWANKNIAQFYATFNLILYRAPAIVETGDDVLERLAKIWRRKQRQLVRELGKIASV